MQYKKLYIVVRDLLRQYPNLRNSDKQLMWKVWNIEGKIHYGSLSELAFFNPKTTTPESVTRARRKLQQQYPELQATAGARGRRARLAQQKGTHIYREYVFDPLKQKYIIIEGGEKHG